MTYEERVLSCRRLVPYLAAKICPRMDNDPHVRAAGTWDDLLGEGYVALCHAARYFDPGRGVKFSSYASRAIWNAFLGHLYVSGNLLRIPKWRYFTRKLPRDVPGMFAGSGEAMAAIVAPHEDYDDLYEALGQLDPRDRELIRRYYWGNEELTTMAREEGLTRATLSLRHRKALEKLRAELERDAA